MDKDIISSIGKTPLVRLKRIEEYFGLKIRIYAKLESFNPTGSLKDRVAYRIVSSAKESGSLLEGGTIIEATSGNMGISLAMLASLFGYKSIIFMPEGVSRERIALIKIYGGRVLLTPVEQGMKGAVDMAEKLALDTKNAYTPCQFTNKQSIFAHFYSTGPEIWKQTKGDIDIFISGVGTGGSLMGVAGYLKKRKPSIKAVAVEPAKSAVLSGGASGSHRIQGIGAGFVPPLYDRTLVDGVTAVNCDEAIEMTRLLALREGIFVGFSSGAVLWAAVSIGKMVENSGKSIVILLADGGEKYLSALLD